MSEKEKMLGQQIYDANNDSLLLEERLTAKELCHEFNQTKPRDIQKQKSIINKIIGKTGNECTILAPFWCDYGYNIEIGNNFFANHNLVILDANKVVFGNNVYLGPGCGFYTSGHPLDAKERSLGLEYAYPITVGNDVWFGASVQVLPGVVIGSNVVVGAGSVVTKSIPDNCIVAGNPAKIIRKIEEK